MTAMTWQLTQDVGEFRAVAGPLLEAEATLCTMLLGVGESRLLLWEADGVPVAMAGRSATVLGQAEIAFPVYTPRPSRGRGYAGAVTAAAGRAAIAAGASQVLLFTDLANPTSNALYPRIGYRPVGDFLSVAW
jgi:predicted GNAT family acetyltransferase